MVELGFEPWWLEFRTHIGAIVLGSFLDSGPLNNTRNNVIYV